ncbi:PAS domain-containing protein [Thiohalocapsa sp. ML1]|uniref:PAS domain-containing protein n=1 Tax=Thiohalocapsa sp. ML1 TaxID=1431688 RepID=UPI003527284B
MLDLDGTVLEANRPPLEAAGISAADVLGRAFWDCYWWSYSAEVQARLREAACPRPRRRGRALRRAGAGRRGPAHVDRLPARAAARRRRPHHPPDPLGHGHHRAPAGGGGPAGGRSAQGRVPGDPGPRAAQPACAHPHRAGFAAARP